jgi:hypothetical protein
MPTQYSVAQGDCISSIAARCGTPWETLWNHPDNASLKQTRQDPNVLFPGDVVTIPDKETRREQCPTDQKHKFQKKDSLPRIKIRLLIDDKPRANIPYELQVAGRTVNGSTNSDGYLEEDIPPDAQNGVLIVAEGTTREIYNLGLGTLDPIDTEEGVRERLESLGFDAEVDLAAAVRAFQSKQGLDPSGTIDDDLRNKLQEKFGQ